MIFVVEPFQLKIIKMTKRKKNQLYNLLKKFSERYFVVFCGHKMGLAKTDRVQCIRVSSVLSSKK